MNKINNLEELFIDQLQDRYSAAQQQEEAFEKLYAACTHSGLRQILKDDIKANKGHLENLKRLLEQVGANPEGEYCEGTAGLVKEAIDTLDLFEKNEILDVAIAISVQHINHHDIAGYNGCALLAKKIGKPDLEPALKQMLEDEKKTDSVLNEFMEKFTANN